MQVAKHKWLTELFLDARKSNIKNETAFSFAFEEATRRELKRLGYVMPTREYLSKSKKKRSKATKRKEVMEGNSNDYITFGSLPAEASRHFNQVYSGDVRCG